MLAYKRHFPTWRTYYRFEFTDTSRPHYTGLIKSKRMLTRFNGTILLVFNNFLNKRFTAKSSDDSFNLFNVKASVPHGKTGILFAGGGRKVSKNGTGQTTHRHTDKRDRSITSSFSSGEAYIVYWLFLSASPTAAEAEAVASGTWSRTTSLSGRCTVDRYPVTPHTHT